MSKTKWIITESLSNGKIKEETFIKLRNIINKWVN